MSYKMSTRSFEAVVPADEHGSSCLPVVAQAAVPADTCDLRARIIEAEKREKECHAAANFWIAEEHRAQDRLVALRVQFYASKTHVGGNPAMSCEGGHTLT